MAMNSGLSNLDYYICEMEDTRNVMCTNPHCQRRIRELEEELLRVKSVGYDMLKQRGGWQAGVGKTPSDRSLEFNNFFDHEVEDFSKNLVQNEGMEEDKARQLACNEFQEMNTSMKSILLNRLVRTLDRVFTISSPEECNEQLYDICRAYGLLLNSSGLTGQHIPEEICAKATFTLSKKYKSVSVTAMEMFTTKSAQLSWNLLTTIPPLVSDTPHSAYFREWHEKELAPTWNKDLVNYKLVYYRPVLFMSCDGKVARKGWVGNEASSIEPLMTDPSRKKDSSNEPSKTKVISRLKHKIVEPSDSVSPEVATIVPSPHSRKHPCAISYSRTVDVPRDQLSSKFYPQSIDVNTSSLSAMRNRSKQPHNSWENWTKKRGLM